MSSAWSITRAVNPPRAVYLDFPLGHTAGRRNDVHEQRAIMRDTLAAFESIDTAGTIVTLDYTWQDTEDWKDRVMRPDPDRASSGHSDDRVERHPEPQYQTAEDAELADTACPTCIWLE